jgi:hypothetical protein
VPGLNVRSARSRAVDPTAGPQVSDPADLRLSSIDDHLTWTQRRAAALEVARDGVEPPTLRFSVAREPCRPVPRRVEKACVIWDSASHRVGRCGPVSARGEPFPSKFLARQRLWLPLGGAEAGDGSAEVVGEGAELRCRCGALLGAHGVLPGAV